MENHEAPNNVFEIPEINLPKLQEKFLKMARKAERLGVPSPTLVVGEAKDVEEMHKGKGTGIFTRFYTVTVEGQAPHYDGWTFLGTLEAVDGEVMTRSVPGCSIPRRFANASTCYNCDHCNTVRRRHETFVVKSDAGEFKQVGRTCLSAFLGGGTDPKEVAAMLSFLFEACEAASEESELRGCNNNYISVEGFMAYAAMAIRKEGWVSRAEAAKYI